MLRYQLLLSALLVHVALVIPYGTSSATHLEPTKPTLPSSEAISSRPTLSTVSRSNHPEMRTISHLNDSALDGAEGDKHVIPLSQKDDDLQSMRSSAREELINGSSPAFDVGVNTTKMADGNAPNQTVVVADGNPSAQNQTVGAKIPDDTKPFAKNQHVVVPKAPNDDNPPAQNHDVVQPKAPVNDNPPAQNQDVAKPKGPDGDKFSDQIPGEKEKLVGDKPALKIEDEPEPDEGDGGGDLPSEIPRSISSLKPKIVESDVDLANSQFSQSEDASTVTSTLSHPFSFVLLSASVIFVVLYFVRRSEGHSNPEFAPLNEEFDVESGQSPISKAPESEVDRLVISVLQSLGVPLFGAEKFQRAFSEQYLTSIEQLKVLDSNDWKRLGLPPVIEEAIRDRLSSGHQKKESESHSRRSTGLNLKRSSDPRPSRPAVSKQPANNAPIEGNREAQASDEEFGDWNFDDEDDGQWTD